MLNGHSGPRGTPVASRTNSNLPAPPGAVIWLISTGSTSDSKSRSSRRSDGEPQAAGQPNTAAYADEMASVPSKALGAPAPTAHDGMAPS